ncbi:ankyrin [Acephala macrosclerotiorum]|nr:ankyrin [Acephala macrosclerotiorum]
MKLGAGTNATDTDGYTTLMAAAITGDEESTNAPTKTGVNVNRQAKYCDALQLAASKGRARALQVLINNGADVNARCYEYGYAIQAGAVKGKNSVVHILVSKRANIHAPGGKHRDALQVGAAGGRKAKTMLEWL